MQWINQLGARSIARFVWAAVVAYATAAWGYVTVVDTLLQAWEVPSIWRRGLTCVLAAGFGLAVLAGWRASRRARGLPPSPATPRSWLIWVFTATLPTLAVAAFFLLRTLLVPAPSLPEKSVAVLPFESLSAEAGNAFFADGVQDELLRSLAQIAELKVICRSSVMQYRDTAKRNLPEIGKTLGVTYLVEGSVSRFGDKIRVSARLVNAQTKLGLWTGKYDREASDVFAIQSDISQAIADQLRVVLSPPERATLKEVPTRDEKAYDLYRSAQTRWDELNQGEDVRKLHQEVCALLEQAVERDPNFVLAWTLLARVQATYYPRLERTPAQQEIVRRLVDKVIKLSPRSLEANLARGYLAYYVQSDYPAARAAFTEVVRRLPNDKAAVYALAMIDRRLGQWDSAATGMLRASELDPQNSAVFLDGVLLLAATRRYDAAVARLDQRLATRPQDDWMHFIKADGLLDWRGDSRGARAELAHVKPDLDADGTVTLTRMDCDEFEGKFAAARRTLDACPLAELDGSPRAMRAGFNAYYHGDRKGAAAALGQALPILQERASSHAEDYVNLMRLAKVEAMLGRKDEAMGHARQALDLLAPDDVVWRAYLEAEQASVLALLGKRDEAIKVLMTLSEKPYGPSYGRLRYGPIWAGLRGDSRFKKIIALRSPKP